MKNVTVCGICLNTPESFIRKYPDFQNAKSGKIGKNNKRKSEQLSKKRIICNKLRQTKVGAYSYALEFFAIYTSSII